MTKIFSRFNYPIWFPTLIGFLLRIVHLNTPIVGIHSWRQADTAAMARHFALEGTPIWLPQIDWAGASKGYVECEFPIFPYIVGQIYKLFGVHESIGRGLSVLLSIMTILLVIRIGSKIFDPISGWWGGLFFALLPLNIYYGRTFQAESLLLFLAAISIDQLFVWKKRSSISALFISWVAFCIACLIKLLPFIWLGLPLLVIQVYYKDQLYLSSFKDLFRLVVKTIKSPVVWIYALSTIAVVLIWFVYSYHLGQQSGHSFFIWGKETDRVSLDMLINAEVWLNLFLRILVRNCAIFGIFFVFLCVWKCGYGSGIKVLNSGLLGIFICTALSMRSSSVHEYYQLPLQLFLCPMMGRGWNFLSVSIGAKRISKYLLASLLSMLTFVSITVLSIDYWQVEINQEKIWMPLANVVRSEVNLQDRIVTVTGLDPTLLNLSRRQGWLSATNNVNQANVRYWLSEGGKYILGSLNWQESYIPMNRNDSGSILNYLSCTEDFILCPHPPNYIYLIPLNSLIEDD